MGQVIFTVLSAPENCLHDCMSFKIKRMGFSGALLSSFGNNLAGASTISGFECSNDGAR